MYHWARVSLLQCWPYICPYRGATGIATVELNMHVRFELPLFVLNGVAGALSRQAPCGANTVVDVFHKLTAIPDHRIVEQR